MKNPMIHKTFPGATGLFASAIVAVAIPSAAAAVLFSDNFESYGVGDTIETTVWNFAGGTGGNASRIVRDETTATPFGGANQYAELKDLGTATADVVRLQSPAIADASNALTTLSFNYHEVTTPGGASSINFGYARGTSDLGSMANVRLRFAMTNGNISAVAGTTFNSTGTTSYSLDTSYRIHLIFNDTASAVDYLGGTIAPFTADLWIEPFGSGSFGFVGNALSTGDQGSSYNVAFRTFAATVREFWLDDVLLETGAAAIPEPSATLLGGLGLLALLRRRRA